MPDQEHIVVAGAGIFGFSAALAIQRRGNAVLLLDPELGELNASAVAAGLLAPVGEAIFDPAASGHHRLLKEAYRLWPPFGARAGLQLSDDGLRVQHTYATAARALSADVVEHGVDVLIAGDGRISAPPVALTSLRQVFMEAGGQIEARAFRSADLKPGGRVVLATGSGSGQLTSIAPELAWLTPVKGQIAVLPSGPVTGPTVRWAGGYLAPQAGGARVGATMEEGVADTRVEPAVIHALIAEARRHVPGLDATEAYGLAGVRMQTPDALPLVGPSRTAGVLLAAGARRNGWLLGPLVGEIIAAYVMGEDPGPWAAMLHPGRFD